MEVTQSFFYSLVNNCFNLKLDSPIEDLPDDLLAEIFSQLSIIDKMTISHVCKRWRNVARDGLPSSKLINLLRAKTKLFGSNNPNHSIKALITFKSIVAFSLYSDESKLSTIYLHDVSNGRNEEIKRYYRDDNELCLTDNFLIACSKSDFMFYKLFWKNSRSNIMLPNRANAYDTENKLLAICLSYQNEIQVFSPPGQIKFKIPTEHHICKHICFCRNFLIAGGYLDTNSKEILTVYSMITSSFLKEYVISSPIKKIAANDQFIAVLCQDNIYIFNPDTFEIEQTLEPLEENLVEVKVQNDKLICLMESNQIKIVDLQQKIEEKNIEATTLTSDGRYLFTSYNKPEIEIWDLKKIERIHTLKTVAKVRKLHLFYGSNKENACLAAGLSEGQVQVWNHASQHIQYLFQMTHDLFAIFKDSLESNTTISSFRP